VTATGALSSPLFSLSLSLSIESRLELGSSLSSTPTRSLSLPPPSLSLSLSCTKFSGTPPPVYRRNIIRPTKRPPTSRHIRVLLVSSPGRVSGVHSRACTHARVHAAVRHTSVSHPNVCQRPRNFAALIRLQYYEHKRVCALTLSANFIFHPKSTTKNRSTIFLFRGRPRRRVLPSPGKRACSAAVPGRVGVISWTRENITLLRRGRIVAF